MKFIYLSLKVEDAGVIGGVPSGFLERRFSTTPARPMSPGRNLLFGLFRNFMHHWGRPGLVRPRSRRAGLGRAGQSALHRTASAQPADRPRQGPA